MIHIAIIVALGALHTAPEANAQVPADATRSGECVVLLHGLGRSASSMRKMEDELSAEGYAVANVSYPSRSAPIEDLAEMAVPDGVATCRKGNAKKIHFVTHSLGGILLRYFVKENAIEELHRSVMLAPPNKGSAAADVYKRVPGFRLLNGEAGFQLGTDEKSIPLTLGAVEFDVGIIAGDRTIDPVSSKMLKNPDDGKVSVESTKVEGMNDFLLVHHSHAFIMKSDEVIRQTKHYLDIGLFDHPPAGAVSGAGSAETTKLFW